MTKAHQNSVTGGRSAGARPQRDFALPLLTAAATWLLLASSPNAQTSIAPGGLSVVGDTGGLAPLPNHAPARAPRGMGPRLHLNSLGKPCVTVRATARSSTINRDIFDHVVLAINSCAALIKLK